MYTPTRVPIVLILLLPTSFLSYTICFTTKPFLFQPYKTSLSPLNNQCSNDETGTEDSRSSNTIVNINANKDNKSTICFESDPMEVYIEDTDAYGVMYNANYIRCYERALHLMAVSSSDQQMQQWEEPYRSSSVLNNPRWFVLSVTNHKFRGSPTLGGKFTVRGQLVKGDSDLPDRSVETWSLKLVCAESQKLYNEAVVTISEPFTLQKIKAPISTKPPIFTQEPKQFLHEVTLVPYRDEFDINLGSTHMPLRNVLSLFERSRTRFIGGPDMLRKLQEDDNILYVVTSISNLSLINLNRSIDDYSSDITIPVDDTQRSKIIQCEPGKDVAVKTCITMKRNGMILVFYHTLLVPITSTDVDSNVVTKRRRLTQGIVTIIAIDKHTRRPTSKIPSYLLDSFHKLTAKNGQ